MTDTARRDKRFPSKQLLFVRCESWAEFAQLYAADVSRGGMFIETDQPPPILSEIEVDMRLPEGHSVLLKASVVHVFGAEQAEREGKRPGVGVQFVNLNSLQKQQIVQLVEFARWEGDSPTASYASRMFETSTSLPPSKVLEALSERNPVARGSLRAGGVHATQPAPASSNRAATAESAQPAPRSSLQAGSAAAENPQDVAVKDEKRRPLGSREPDAETGAESAERSTSPNPRARRSDGGHVVPAVKQPTPPPPAVPPRPLDAAKLKLGMTHLAHKRLDQAIKTFAEVLQETPGDKQASQWFHIAHARLRLRSSDADGAAEHYQKALEAEENNHEARKFVREHCSKKRLNSLPFGRYFVKKP